MAIKKKVKWYKLSWNVLLEEFKADLPFLFVITFFVLLFLGLKSVGVLVNK